MRIAIFTSIIASLLVVGAALALEGSAIERLGRSRPDRTSYMRHRADAEGAPAAKPRWADLDAISPLLACAVVKAEQPRYFVEPAIRPAVVADRARAWLAGRPTGGGSGIIQQLARNLFLTPEVTIGRKLHEALLAVEFEQSLSKRRILELYLNVIEWGRDAWGAQAAARAYFDKDAAALSPFEATFLAALVAAPRHPITGANRTRVHRLQRRILTELYMSGLIDADAWRDAVSRADAVADALLIGRPLPVALRAPTILLAPPIRARRNPSPLPIGAAIVTGCGLARELSESGAGWSRYWLFVL